MAETYRVEAVEAGKPVSHADFFRLPRIYVLRRLRDGAVRRLTAPSLSSWSVGSEIQLLEASFAGNAG